MPGSLFSEGHKEYIKPGQKLAPGTPLYHGPHGGVYYIPGEKPEKQELATQPPAQEKKPSAEEQIAQWQANFKALGQSHQTLETEFKKEYDLRCEKGWMDYAETPEERNAIADWVHSGHSDINAILREIYSDDKGLIEPEYLKQNESQIKAEIIELDTVLSRSTVHQDYTIFRGVSGNTWEKITTLYKEGKLDTHHSFEDKGFTSWTYNYKVSKSFTPESDEPGKLGLICRMNIKTGDHALVISGNEDEILLPRAKKWTLKGYSTQKIEGGDFLVLDLEEEGNNGKQG